MRVPLDWLREYVDLPDGATGDQVAADLVSVGLEEEGLHTAGVTGPLVAGRVLTCRAEPQQNGKVITWCTVDVGAANGTGEPQGIVCGAHNVQEGQLVPVVLPGGSVQTPQGPLVVGARKTYGHLSAGMICAEDELGLGEDHTGIIVLTDYLADQPQVLAALHPGDDLLGVLGLDRETVEVNVTPDRGYCFAIRGIAREYSHATGAAFTDPAVELAARAPAATSRGYAVHLRDETPIRGRAGCDRYVARLVRGIDVAAPSPSWLRLRLTEAGMRPISLAVDVTNYVMLALGQPLHAFDAAALDGPIVVRRARPGERLRTLDDVDRALEPGDLLITDGDGERAVAIAGVMGGAQTEVTAATSDVLIEAAHFDPVTIARSARRHKLPSEASRRFERGVDPDLAPAAAQLAVDLLVEYGGGVVDPEVTDVGEPVTPLPVTMSADLPARIVGVDYDLATVTRVLTDIGCTVVAGPSAAGQGIGAAPPVLEVTPPTWRPDLRTGEDLVEEVARVEGYEAIPSVLPTPPGGGGLTHGQRARRLLADVLAAQGLWEVWSAPFVGDDRHAALGLDVEAERARTVRIANPLSEEQPLMRTRVLSTLVDALRRNVARGATDVGLFEIGQVVDLVSGLSAAPTEEIGVHPSAQVLARIRAAVPPQPRHLALLLAGDRDRAGHWGRGRRADLGDVLELAQSLGQALGLVLVVTADDVMPYHPGRCALLALPDGTQVGHVGELHPRVVAALGVPVRTVAGELDVDVLVAASGTAVRAHTLTTYPAAHTDVALVVDAATPASAVEAALRAGADERLESVRLFDTYRGDQIGADQISLAYRLTFRAPDRTLTTDQVSTLRDAAVARAGAEVGAVQRT